MNVEDVLSKLEEVRSQTIERLIGLSQGQLDAHPPTIESEQPWSLGEVFMHIAIDEVYLRELISRPLREGTNPPEGITLLPPPPPYGTTMEVIQFWLSQSRSQTRAYVNDWPSSWDPDLRHEGDLRSMNALEWLEGYCGHEAFHHLQIDALIKWCADTGVS